MQTLKTLKIFAIIGLIGATLLAGFALMQSLCPIIVKGATVMYKASNVCIGMLIGLVVSLTIILLLVIL